MAETPKQTPAQLREELLAYYQGFVGKPGYNPFPMINKIKAAKDEELASIKKEAPVAVAENIEKKVVADLKTTREVKRVFRDEKDRIAGIETIERQEVVNG